MLLEDFYMGDMCAKVRNILWIFNMFTPYKKRWMKNPPSLEESRIVQNSASSLVGA